MGLNRHGRGQIVEERSEIKIDNFKFHLLRFNFGKIEDIVDQAQQIFAARTGQFGILALLVVQAGIQEQSIHADDPVEGGPNFVAHIGQKFTFRLVRRLGRIGQFRDMLHLIL